MSSGVHDLKEIAGLENELFGNKVNLLSKAMQYGIPVPPGFCVTLKLDKDIEKQIAEMTENIREAYRLLCEKSGAEEPPLIIRSSCDAEDQKFLLFSGIFQSLHNICGFNALLRAIVCCCQSAQVPAVTQYLRLRHRERPLRFFTALVQSEQRPDYAGIASSAIPLLEQGNEGTILVQLTEGHGSDLLRGIGAFNSYTVFRKCSGEISFRRIRDEISISSQTANVILSKLYRLMLRLQSIFGAGIGVEWGICGGKLLVFQVRPFCFVGQDGVANRTITALREDSAQGVKYQAMRYFREHGMFSANILLFKKHTPLREIEKRLDTLQTDQSVTVRFSAKQELGLPRYFALNAEDALRYLHRTAREDWSVILYNSIRVLDSYELYLSSDQTILEHIPGMWESDSRLFADAVFQNSGRTDYWLTTERRLAKIEDEEGVSWKIVKPASLECATALMDSLSPVIQKLKRDFADDLPLNFHFVRDECRFYFLNCRLSAQIIRKNGLPGTLHRVAVPDDVRTWDGRAAILFEPDLERGEEIFLLEYIPFLTAAKVPVFVKFGVLSHPAIMLREFGVDIRPVFLRHTHYSIQEKEEPL